jgi:hypothetical protein
MLNLEKNFYAEDGKNIYRIYENGVDFKAKFLAKNVYLEKDTGKFIHSICEFDKDKNLLNQVYYKPEKCIYYRADGKTIEKIVAHNNENEVNFKVKFLEKKIYIEDTDKFTYSICELDKDGNLLNQLFYKFEKCIYYREDGKTIERIDEYNKNGNVIKKIFYLEDGKTIEKIYEFNNENEEYLSKKIFYLEDGKTIHRIDEFDNEGYLIW